MNLEKSKIFREYVDAKKRLGELDVQIQELSNQAGDLQYERIPKLLEELVHKHDILNEQPWKLKFNSDRDVFYLDGGDINNRPLITRFLEDGGWGISAKFLNIKVFVAGDGVIINFDDQTKIHEIINYWNLSVDFSEVEAVVSELERRKQTLLAVISDKQ